MSKFYNNIAVDEVTDKSRAIKHFLINMLNKTNNIFQYTGTPETLKPKFMELYLQTGGYGFVTEFKDNLYIFEGGLGGEPDEYYQPTIFTVANPHLKFNKNLKIGKEGVLCRNDTLMLGLKPVLLKYGTLIVENLISFRVAAINTRIQTIIDATDDSAYASAQEYLRKIENGDLSVIASDDLFAKIHVNPAATHNNGIVDLIQLNQYLLSQLYSEIGIADNYNMKRERLTTAEAIMIRDKPAVSLENMYEERCLFCDEINRMYGTNIKVKINERWDDSNADTERSVPESDERFVQSDESTSGRMASNNETN